MEDAARRRSRDLLRKLRATRSRHFPQQHGNIHLTVGYAVLYPNEWNNGYVAGKVWKNGRYVCVSGAKDERRTGIYHQGREPRRRRSPQSVLHPVILPMGEPFESILLERIYRR